MSGLNLSTADVRRYLIEYPDGTCRVTRAVARECLIHNDGRLAAKGNPREIAIKSLGAGAYQVSLKERPDAAN